MSQHTTGYPDLHDHLEELKRRGLLQVIDRPIDKDSELHPLVRWQFVGGMDEAALGDYSVREITRQTIPEDFRNERIHKCWVLTRRE